MKLGDVVVSKKIFSSQNSSFQEFQSKEFRALNEQERSECVSAILLEHLLGDNAPPFALPAVLDYIDRVNKEKVLEHYTFSHFELWLNQTSGLSKEDNYRVRARIVGKYVPRDTYQIFFPISSGKSYPGSHYVTAHGSPDLDTTVASFWGWVDAFGARVADGLHLWNVPGGPPEQVEIALLFTHYFGPALFEHLAKNRPGLSVSGLDLLQQKGMIKKETTEASLTSQHARDGNAIVLVDDQGYFLGDWRAMDVEGVTQVIMLLNSCLRFFENNVYIKLVSLFSREKLSTKDLPAFTQGITGMALEDSPPAKMFTDRQKEYVDLYLKKVLRVSKGLKSSFKEFAEELSIQDFKAFIDALESMDKSPLFDASGKLVENRSQLFHFLEKMIKALEKGLESFTHEVDKLDVALSIKTEVFGHLPQAIGYRADIEEIRSKMGAYSYLTVTYSDQEGRVMPMGVIRAVDLHRPMLGTVTLRDFCNREETHIPSYLEVISIVDHHKGHFTTSTPSSIMISDAQSSNTLVAEMAFVINDAFSTGGMSAAEIEAQIKNEKNRRVLKRLLQKALVAEKKSVFYIVPEREYEEYLHFLYAILEDTDLLTKVSLRDVECVAMLLNRLKSLVMKQELEVIDFTDIPRDEKFVKKAAARILQNEEMYSLYKKIYHAKEEAVEQHLVLGAQGLPSSVFADTKEQNGCCRVGQTKLFAKNFPGFFHHIKELRNRWVLSAKEAYKEKKEIDLHLHMISTIASAEDLFKGKSESSSHQDELWIWIPGSESSIEHLKSFLSDFGATPAVVQNNCEVEFLGDNAKELDQIFTESFPPFPRRILTGSHEMGPPIAVLRFNPGSINSRKSMISPFLPNK